MCFFFVFHCCHRLCFMNYKNLCLFGIWQRNKFWFKRLESRRSEYVFMGWCDYFMTNNLRFILCSQTKIQREITIFYFDHRHHCHYHDYPHFRVYIQAAPHTLTDSLTHQMFMPI